MPRIEVRTVEGITLELDVAGAGTRFLAGLLDALLLVLLLLLIGIGLKALAAVDPTGVVGFAQALLLLGFALVIIAYHVLYHHLAGGQTPGKQAMGIRVVTTDGQPAGLASLTLRGVLMIVDALPLPLFTGLVAIVVTPRRQRLGDLVAGTLVVRDARQDAYGLEPWGQETWSGLQVRVLDLSPAAAARFDRDDLAFLREVITRRTMDPLRRKALLRRVARDYAGRLGFEREEDPRAIIRELYIFLREHRAGLREAPAA